jgi:hypothetical protein
MAAQRLRRSDLIWLLAYPVYQTVGTLRHEGAHALGAVLGGATIQRFVFWPSWWHGAFEWGYVEWSGPTTWLAIAAPFLGDVLTFSIAFAICSRLPVRRHWIWVNLVILGLISPLVDSAYEYVRGLRAGGDVGYLLTVLPPPAVHAYFIATLLLYFVGLAYIAGLAYIVAVHSPSSRPVSRPLS